MTERGLEPSGYHGSALNNDELGSGNLGAPNGSRSSSLSLSLKRRIACSFIAIAFLCLVQLGVSTMYLSTSTSTSVDSLYSRIMNLPTVQSGVPESDADTNSNTDDTINDMAYFINITTPQPQLTLVHFDPKFLGGYRNQHMRFVAFVNFAVEHSIPQILLPSVRYGVAQGEHRGRDVSFEYLFDVVYWNEQAKRAGLPRFVRYDASVLEGTRRRNPNGTNLDNNNKTTAAVACFNTSSNLYSGLNELLLRNPNTNIRKVNVWEEIGRLDGYSHCRRLPPSSAGQDHKVSEDGDDEFTYLIAHGGSKGVGRLVSSRPF